ncbi:MAG: hypothetical protein DRJ42_25285 [Deltaproteobacteria bacterium]|nr:MAG: hypothetical protein DRJ42_25285 [Deltaproteobacteria bacterium]
MQKPTDIHLSTDGSFDVDLTERVARQLQSSALHVYEANTMSALPDALCTGSAHDAHTSIHVPLTMVTDGRRGWLILSTEDGEYDVEKEFTDLVDSIVPGSASRSEFVLRGVIFGEDDPGALPRSLRLTDASRVRAVVEGAYEAAFAGAGDVDHEAFLGAFRACGFPPKDEREIRRFFIELGSPADEGAGACRSAPEPAPSLVPACTRPDVS